MMYAYLRYIYQSHKFIESCCNKTIQAGGNFLRVPNVFHSSRTDYKNVYTVNNLELASNVLRFESTYFEF